MIANLDHNLSEYYRLPKDFPSHFLNREIIGHPGFFRFGSEGVCFGRCQTGPTVKSPSPHLYDALSEVQVEDHCVRLPFDPSEVIDNLRLERYVESRYPSRTGLSGKSLDPQGVLCHPRITTSRSQTPLSETLSPRVARIYLSELAGRLYR